MTTEQKRILYRQLQSINNHGTEFVSEFYRRLFEQYPHLRVMFKSTLSEQYTKFMSMLSIIIKGMGNPSIIVPLIAEMGESHKSYGVLPHHYTIIEDIFLSVLRDTFPDDYNDEIEQAWKQAFQFMSRIMQE
ncbi:MAG TPA: globin domain-containing protein [Candidatus Kapabacteria bacterium]|jgi:hemoglobin-like flavoprotein|nr:hemoglobin [Ignavibacteria bacterium]HRE56749.1 globin domain-containing protein [Candidatus Kapabacteria bacterium]HRK58417.1 globin domain-containing protein [Candidatus Kapabacteria bacterium]